MAATGTDAITLITRDHREMERLFEEMRTDVERRPELVRTLGAMLIAHSRAEEEHVYPEVAKAAPQEADEVEHSKEEHEEAERILHQLEQTDPASDEFESVLDELVGAVEHHVQEEESEVLPALAEAVGQKRLRELGKIFKERRAQEMTAYEAESTRLTPAPRQSEETARGRRTSAAGSGRKGSTRQKEPAGSAKGAPAQREPSRDELYEKARELGVEGRSKMTKDELAAAVSGGRRRR
ncbi:hemerythrin domain-containing protein [Streptoalloteichus hindustanus]|uniref:Rho termination factor, N-terminal domain n=1 Tax=Streptoalloteichus hindustanus TaxID=2017 RepID=A0A1M5NDV9_STRHI|nr:hemerythrin domain-containing protein [Streptoalloteichus hindustanus]SHG87645.1 Rho termination factor, N-terminal domain [Streptoalloteichus hindustanus]